ncbi:hypothetical protein LWI28_011928 [Acer negundo]|uniref:RNase H type-1 domain-containing protein n=1 Tax=Acer negundo TaxID=4023 RepID=A0AAD5IUE4_ACENE|nr:hypothetical protein LWI28_011928 [Acer negundo]
MNLIGTPRELQKTAEYFKKEFKMKDLGKKKYCLCLEIEHGSNGILVHQSAYTEKILKRFHMDNAHPLSTHMVVRILDHKNDPFRPKDNGEKILGPEVFPRKLQFKWWKIRGYPRPAGIGGALRNSDGKIFCQFSLSVGFQDSISAEILAILKACELCTSNISLVNSNIQIVSDSRVAVSWANSSEDFESFMHLNVIYDIRDYLQRYKGLSIIFNPRSTNELADSLAKLSSNGCYDSLVWSVF